MTDSAKRVPSCILGTCCVPWDERFQFAETIFCRQVARLLEQGTKHLYIFGTAGEGYAVTDSQFDQITRAFCHEMSQANAAPMVGIISLSQGTVGERIQRARDWGVRDFQISLPAWGACNFDDIRRFFDATCGQFRDCRFLHYNLPRTKRLVTPGEYAQLAAAHPNLVATKSSADSLGGVSDLVRHAPQLQHFLTEYAFTAACLLGLEVGLLISISSINWTRAQQFFEAGRTGDLAKLQRDFEELRAVRQTMRAAVGEGERMDGTYDKLFCRLHDPQFPLRLLPPYEGSSAAQCEQFARSLRTQFPTWSPK